MITGEKPIIVCMRRADMPSNATPLPGVLEGRCVVCNAVVLLAISGRRAVDAGEAQSICKQCAVQREMRLLSDCERN